MPAESVVCGFDVKANNIPLTSEYCPPGTLFTSEYCPPGHYSLEGTGHALPRVDISLFATLPTY